MTDVPKTPADAAEMLNGRQYRVEVSKDEARALKAAGLVAVYGGSDDLVYLDGAESDELGAGDGTKIYLTPKGLLRNDCESDECPHFLSAQKSAAFIETIWDADGYSWTYKTNIPHATFEIMEDADKYCKGIVFRLSDVPTGAQ